MKRFSGKLRAVFMDTNQNGVHVDVEIPGQCASRTAFERAMRCKALAENLRLVEIREGPFEDRHVVISDL